MSGLGLGLGLELGLELEYFSSVRDRGIERSGNRTLVDGDVNIQSVRHIHSPPPYIWTGVRASNRQVINAEGR